MIRNAKKDANQKEIENYIKAIGGEFQDCTQLKNAFDLLMGYKGKLYIIEVKNPEYLSKKLSKVERLEKSLTEGEKKCRDKFEKVGINYYIIEDIEGIKEMLK